MKQIPDDENISVSFIISLFEEEEDKEIVRRLISGVPSRSIVKEIVQSFCGGEE